MIETSLVPEPIDWDVVVLNDDKLLLVPHSNHAVVAPPLGFTLPFNVAADELTLVAVLTTTVGKFALVVTLKMLDLCVPALFCPTTR